jgi:MFS family permease
MATADIAATPVADIEHRGQLRRAVIASTVGTTIEWYDFLVYGQMAALVFGKLYFPKSDPLTDTLEAFAVFAVGFAARPIGAAIFGHYGDRIGRKAALIARCCSPAYRPSWSDASQLMSRSVSGARC